MTNSERLTGLLLSAAELQNLTDWDARVIEDYLDIVGNVQGLATSGDLDAVQIELNRIATVNNASAIGTNTSKLSGIDAGAEVNVQSDWAETTNTEDSFILNKPAFGSFSEYLSDDTGGVNNTQNFVQYMQLAFVAPADGAYVFEFSYVWSYNHINSNFLCDVTYDANLPVASLVVEPSDSGGNGIDLPDLNGGADIDTGTDQRFQASGFSRKILLAGAHTLQIAIACQNNNREAAIYQGNLRVVRDA